MREIKIWKDPYDAGFEICKKRNIQIEEGLTVLVGCNGTGKSTLIQNIKSELDKANMPCAYYNNLHDGGDMSVAAQASDHNWEMVATMVTSSEGENIRYNVCMLAAKMRNFIENGKFVKDEKQARFNRIFMSDEAIAELDKPTESKERWILLDAVDSGYSIDNILELKVFFNSMQEDCKKAGIKIYIIVSSNEYELANGESCFDVHSGKYVTFKDYDDYKTFIIKSRKIKDNRYVKNEGKKTDNRKKAVKKNPLNKKVREV